MLRHLSKLMWNKKKQHLLLVIEIFFSFLVIFAIATMIVFFYRNYRKPIGLEDKDVWTVHFDNADTPGSADSLAAFYDMVHEAVISLPKVREASYTSFNTPFGDAMNITAFNTGNKQVGNVYSYHTDDHYADALGMKLVEGRWFDKTDDAARYQPIIINQSLEQAAFGGEAAVGKVIGTDQDAHKRRIVGVVGDAKVNGDYRQPNSSIWERIDTNFRRDVTTMLVKVTPDADATFEGQLFQLLSNRIKHADIGISHLSDSRSNINGQAIIPLIIFGIIAGFLVLNVAFGLFGVLWYNINRRRGEIGLRRAVGATGGSVATQLWTETLILATFALVLGTFFAVQFPLLHVFDLPTGVYILALIFAILFIYALVTICSLYPGRQAAGIYPAVALHED
ncbi:MAG TPA: FtsX-like permease family protein [Dinghuibacter sp.]|uniref:ABC transporter permease n=1 Tax=Dinghuibacter sp. TaxID=2024697 RepID=UPI002C9E546E|nr:FtsX-like permease family protein [Dinghuibacter sp.]HTJ13115.1 FtsX-like permease family protein [Dinghuibacter sp.]